MIVNNMLWFAGFSHPSGEPAHIGFVIPIVVKMNEWSALRVMSSWGIRYIESAFARLTMTQAQNVHFPYKIRG